MRKKLIIGNWKMHLNVSQGSGLVHRLQERIETHRDVEVVLAPGFLALQPLSLQIDRRKFKLAAQDCYWRDEGAFTGEVSADMLRDLTHYVLVGHSERRHIFGETDDDIAKKVAAVVRNGMVPVVCVGETAPERKAGETKQVLHDQLMVDIKNLTTEEVGQIVVAYEPVWAIGTGDFAKPDQIESAVKTIRHNIEHMFGRAAQAKLRVLYGGSVIPDMTKAYLDIAGIDGLLVGGASLNYDQFSRIVKLAFETAQAEDEHGSQ
jgi:triosephosphate isomerase